MTLKDIAVFKHFICLKDLRRPFITAYYRGKNFAKNPDNIEDYFSNVEPLAVILSATRVCTPNAVFGYDFWQDLHQEWKTYYAKRSDINDKGLSTLEGYYLILRENWNDVQKPWRHESQVIAAGRLGLDPLPFIKEKEMKEEIKEETIVEEPQEDGLEIDFISLDLGRPCRKLDKGLISVNIRHSWRLGINRFDAQTIQDKHLGYVMMGKTKSGDVVIQFNNNSNGTMLNYNNKSYININNRQFVERLRDIMSITDDLIYLRIEKIAEKDDSVTYKVTKR